MWCDCSLGQAFSDDINIDPRVTVTLEDPVKGILHI